MCVCVWGGGGGGEVVFVILSSLKQRENTDFARSNQAHCTALVLSINKYKIINFRFDEKI